MQLPLVAFGAMGLGNHTKHSWVEHAWSWWAAGPSPVLPPVLQASLTFPLVEAEWWFCAPSSSRLRHWEPSSGLQAAGQWMQVRADGPSVRMCMRRCCSPCACCSRCCHHLRSRSLYVTAAQQCCAAG
jgi:hypothetical protein